MPRNPQIMKTAVIRTATIAVCLIYIGACTSMQNGTDSDDVLIADFEAGAFEDWSVHGDAFGDGPVPGPIGGQGSLQNFKDSGFVNSFHGGDGTTGILTSPEFTINRKYLKFLIGGGKHEDKTGIQLEVDGKIVRSETGHDNHTLWSIAWDVNELAGKTGRLKIVDQVTEKWGHITVDHIILSDLAGPIITYQEFTQEESLKRATDALTAAIPKAETSVERPVYHFHPPAQWMNDPNGPLYYKGYYHVFYQYNPYADTWGRMHWGHARSKDLVHWEHLPIALWPSHELGEQHCYSGSATITGEGKPMLFYTSVPFRTNAEIGKYRHREEWAAISDDDMMTWTKIPHLIEHTTKEGERISAQDPFVFKRNNKTYLVSTSKSGYNTTQSLHIYEAVDQSLTKWDHRGEFFDKVMACPNLVNFGDKWALMLMRHYYVGTIDWETFRLEARKIDDLVYGTDFNARASNILFDDDKGRVIFLTWISRRKNYDHPGRGWAGCLSLPTEISLGNDDHLIFKPIEELKVLRGNEQEIQPFDLANEARLIPEFKGDVKEMKFTIRPTDNATFGIRVRVSEDGTRGVSFNFSSGKLLVDGHGEQATEVSYVLREDGTLSVHIFLDNAILEYFLNEGTGYGVQYMHSDVEDTGVELFSRSGKIRVESGKAWDLNPAQFTYSEEFLNQ